MNMTTPIAERIFPNTLPGRLCGHIEEWLRDRGVPVGETVNAAESGHEFMQRLIEAARMAGVEVTVEFDVQHGATKMKILAPQVGGDGESVVRTAVY